MAAQSLPSNPGFVRWEDYLPWLFHKPPQPPMQKGRPQEVESTRPSIIRNPAEEVKKATADVGKGVEEAVNRILGSIFSKEHVRDGAVYGAAALLMVIVIWSALK